MTSQSGKMLEERHILPPTVRDARTALSKLLDEHGWKGDNDSLLLAVQEALVNADRHGRGLREVVVSPGTPLVIEVADFGGSFDWQPYVSEPPDLLAERGRGLWLIAQVATHIEVLDEDDGARVRLTFDAERTGLAEKPRPPAGAEGKPALAELASRLLDAVDGTAVIVDHRLLVADAFGDLERLLGVSSEDVVGRDVRGLAAEVKHRFADPTAYESRLLDICAHHHEVTTDVFVMVDSRLLRHHAFPLRSSDGGHAGLVLVIFPVAEQTEVLATFQRSLLPAVPQSRDLEIGAIYHPAQASAFVGGDFYDFIPLSAGGSCIVVGDVSGRGPVAAATSVRTRAYLRAVLATTGLTGAIPALEQALQKEFGEEDFVTMVMAAQEGRDVWTLASCGHPPPLMVDDKGVREFEARGALLGFETVREWTRQPFILHEGQVLLMYTDGVVEAGTGRQRFGMERLKDALRELRDLPAQRLVEAIDGRLHGYAGDHIDDDHVLLAVRQR